jgi:hypothetical protein
VLRPSLAIFVIALATLVAATPGVSQADPTVTVSVKASAPTSQGGRTPSGLRDYGVSFRVTISADQECENLSVSYSYIALFDGRPSLAGSATEFYNSGAPASSASFEVPATANAADLVAFKGRGTCEQADGTVLSASAPVTAKVAVPAYSCERGPLRVLGLRGSVSRQDLVSPKTRVRLRPGHFLLSGYRLWLGKRSRVVFGAGECHGLRVVANGSSSLAPGDYSTGSYGSPTLLGFGGVADFRGDQHSGGIQTDNAIALPRGARTAPSKVARFQIVSFARKLGRITRVHVTSGTVYVAGRTGPARYSLPVVAKAGQTVVVRCTSRNACKPTTP